MPCRCAAPKDRPTPVPFGAEVCAGMTRMTRTATRLDATMRRNGGTNADQTVDRCRWSHCGFRGHRAWDPQQAAERGSPARMIAAVAAGADLWHALALEADAPGCRARTPSPQGLTDAARLAGRRADPSAMRPWRVDLRWPSLRRNGRPDFFQSSKRFVWPRPCRH